MKKPEAPDPDKGLAFCSACEHFASGYSDASGRHWESCTVAKKRRVERLTYYARSVSLVPESPAEKNAHNDCSDFKPGRPQRYFA